jgi:hypothetical protein
MESPLTIRIPPNNFQPSYCGGNMAPKEVIIQVYPAVHQLQIVVPRSRKKTDSPRR